MPPTLQRFLALVRTLHVYLSMAGLVAIACLAVTGFVLNHKKTASEQDPPKAAEWFDLEGTPQTWEARLPADLLERLRKKPSPPPDPALPPPPTEPTATQPAKTEPAREEEPPSPPKETLDSLLARDIERELRDHHGLVGQMLPPELDEDQLRLPFRRPGLSMDVTIDRKDGRMEIAMERQGFFGTLTDLHKGSRTGRAWRWVIDAAALLLILVTLTGLILTVSMSKHRFMGLVVLVIGAAACVLCYLVLTP
jgi:hypothetical protein